MLTRCWRTWAPQMARSEARLEAPASPDHLKAPCAWSPLQMQRCSMGIVRNGLHTSVGVTHCCCPMATLGIRTQNIKYGIPVSRCNA